MLPPTLSSAIVAFVEMIAPAGNARDHSAIAKILLADDDEAITELAAFLERSGFDVAVARVGPCAGKKDRQSARWRAGHPQSSGAWDGGYAAIVTGPNKSAACYEDVTRAKYG